MGIVRFIIIAYLACMLIVAIVAITIIGSMRDDHKRGASPEALAQIQADLNELKKSVAEIREYITDMYIQQHDQKLK
ncbi:hypothetical protein HYR99_02865 [Candidatus Poribacteria bacterium]|nr:hypothetical protein [Candidatus Poribacteria bacterium]